MDDISEALLGDAQLVAQDVLEESDPDLVAKAVRNLRPKARPAREVLPVARWPPVRLRPRVRLGSSAQPSRSTRVFRSPNVANGAA